MRPESSTALDTGSRGLAPDASIDWRPSDLRRSVFRAIVLDLAALDFVDSAGVHLALRWIDVDGLETRLELGHGPARSGPHHAARPRMRR